MSGTITIDRAIALFKQHGNVLRTKEAMELGINSRTLYRMRDQGYIEALTRGLYRLTDDQADVAYTDLVIVAKRYPKGIVCLISALFFHGLTTQIPRAVSLAYQQDWWQPKSDYPSLQIFRYSKKAFEIGIEYHTINGIKIPIYSPLKTIVDCFKFRNQVGLDIAIEALKDYWHSHPEVRINDILHIAKICSVDKVMLPYIEAITHE